MKKSCHPLYLIAPLAGLLCCGLAAASDTGPTVTDPHFKLEPGYLEPASLPVRLALLGGPPKPDSAAFARDEEARRAALALRGSAREKLAATDAELTFPAPAKSFSCALGTDINEKKTPHLYAMMQHVLTDAGGSTYAGKNAYNRTRPFVQHDEGTCRKDMEPVLRTDGLLAVGPLGGRLGLGIGAGRGAAGTGDRAAGTWPGVWSEPRGLQCALAERRGCRAHHGGCHGCRAA